MDKGERVGAIRRLRDALQGLDTDDQDLLLDTFEIGSIPHDSAWNEPSLTQWLSRNASDEQLLALAQHLEVLEDSQALTTDHARSTDQEPEALFVFASHLSEHRVFLGEVAAELGRYGIHMFVAHDSIPMDAPWEKEIVDALNECHAGAAFIHPGLHDRFYCMQEVGWMLGRGIPIARLMFGEAPRGLLGAHQGRPLLGRGASEVAAAIVDWAVERPVLHPHVATSLTTALDDSPGYRVTDMIWLRLKELQTLTDEQVRRVVHAAESNPQVYGTGVGSYSGAPYRHVIGAQVPGWSAHAALLERADRLRADSTGRPMSSPDDDGEIP